MKGLISICIPVYNFAKFLPETLDSILNQSRIDEIEVVIFDGASNDNTSEIMKSYQKKYSNIKYIRSYEKGGIDKDMALAIDASSNNYCWLFSGDDIMLPGALSKALDKITSNHDLYLTKHLEWIEYNKKWDLWPSVKIENNKVFNTAIKEEREDYVNRAVTTEAFFSFIGGLIFNRSVWNRYPVDKSYNNTCWSHAAHLCRIMKNGMCIEILSEPYLKRRPDNDSFATSGLINRLYLSAHGYSRIADEIFGNNSVEAKAIRRTLRNEIHPLLIFMARYLSYLNDSKESPQTLDEIVRLVYQDANFANLSFKLKYKLVTKKSIEKKHPDLAKSFKEKYLS